MTQTIKRKDFVERFMHQCDMSFSDACRAFECMCDTMKDGVVNGSHIRLGKLGVLRPVWHAPKEVHLGVRQIKGRKYVKQKHVYFLGKRISYDLRIYRKFIDNHQLHWYSEHWPVDDEAQAQ